MATKNRAAIERVTRHPGVMDGRPVVRGTRIPVERVVGQLAYKFDLAELFAIWPDLTIEDVQACLAYARNAVAAQRRATRPDQVLQPAGR